MTEYTMQLYAVVARGGRLARRLRYQVYRRPRLLRFVKKVRWLFGLRCPHPVVATSHVRVEGLGDTPCMAVLGHVIEEDGSYKAYQCAICGVPLMLDRVR
jgi:hypothetical protein